MNADAIRAGIVQTCVYLADRGYLAGTGGNIACRIDEQHFAVTPSATDYYAMKPEDVCVLRLKDCSLVAGNRRPSVESRLHANLLRLRRDCSASIHTHQPVASAYTLLARSLEIDPAHRNVLGARALSVSYAPSGTNWLASKLRKAVHPEVHAYFLQNHGIVCCGPSLKETVARVEALEVVCARYFAEAIEHHADPAFRSLTSDVLMLLNHA